MRYCVYSPSRPDHLHICESRDALDEYLSHDESGGKDWLAEDRVVSDDGRAGAISYDGSIYEYQPTDERLGPERLREVLTAYLTAIGWKPKRYAAAVEQVNDLAGMDAVIKQFPPRVGVAQFAPGCFLLVVIAAVLAGTLWATSHFWGWPRFGEADEPPAAAGP